MERAEKQQQVEALRQSFSGAACAFLVDFQGLSVEHDTALRVQLRAADVRYRVVKNRLAKLALAETALAGLVPRLTGPTAVALPQGDPAAAAKVLVEFARTHPALRIKGGLLEGGQPMAAEGVEALSKLPSLPVMRATLLSTLNAPATRLATILGEPGRQVARVLDARRGQLEKAAS